MFTEIATAMWARACTSDELVSWLTEMVPWTDSDGAIALAAGLDTRAASALIELGESMEEATLLIVELAVEGSVLLAPDEARRCVAQLALLVAAVMRGETVTHRTARTHSELVGRMQEREELESSWWLVERACRVGLSPHDRPARDGLVADANLGTESAAVAAALIALTDADVDSRELTQDDVDRVRAVVALPLPATVEAVHESRRRISFVRGEPAHPGLAPVAVLAASHLEHLDADTARWIFDVSMEAAYGLGTPIRAALRQAGVDFAPWWRESWRFNVAGILAEGQEHERLFLEDIASLDPAPALDDSHPSLWPLAELGDLVLISDRADQHVRALRRAFQEDPADLRRGWLDALCDAYQLPKPVVAAQARSLLARLERDGGSAYPDDDWLVALAERAPGDAKPTLVAGELDEPQQQTLIACLEASSEWLAWPAATALINVPDPVWNGAELAARDFRSRHRSRAALALTVGILSSGEAAPQLLKAAVRSNDPDLRVAARDAIMIDQALDPDGDLRDVLRVDPDLAVRRKADWRREPVPTHWSCACCRRTNDLDVEDCPDCADGTRPDA